MAPSRGVPRLWKLHSRIGVENGKTVLFLEGRLGTATAGALEATIEAASDQAANLEVDLSGVDYLSSASIEVFEYFIRRGRQITFRSPSPAARLSLEFAGLTARTK
jgi:anti-anti-sigma regulatory factor